VLRPDDFGDVDLQWRGLHNDAVIAAAWMCAIDDRLRSGTAKLSPAPPVIRFYFRCRARFPNDAKPDVTPTFALGAERRSEFGIQNQEAVNFGINVYIYRAESVRDFSLGNPNVAAREFCEIDRIAHYIGVLSASISSLCPLIQAANEEEARCNLTGLEVLPRSRALSLDRRYCFC